MTNNIIKINGKEYKVKYTLRALFIFEQITGKAFEVNTLLDNYVFFYSIILANNPDTNLDWDEFIEALDNDTLLYKTLNDIIKSNQKTEEIFNTEETNKDGETVKKN